MMISSLSNSCGCLRVSGIKSALVPQKISDSCGKGVVSFAYRNGPRVVALISKGELFIWSHNGYCELASGTTTQDQSPIRVEGSLSNKVVVEIACGSHHCVALSNVGKVFARGQIKCGQIGSRVDTNQNSPRRVNSATGGKFILGQPLVSNNVLKHYPINIK